MIDDNLVWLLKWYQSQCDGDWEHGNGIKIETVDNPGWHLRISLEGTELEEKQFQEIGIDRSEHDWIRCFLKGTVFEGAGGPFNLPEVLKTFREWAEDGR
jgi:hypothetical protein